MLEIQKFPKLPKNLKNQLKILKIKNLEKIGRKLKYPEIWEFCGKFKKWRRKNHGLKKKLATNCKEKNGKSVKGPKKFSVAKVCKKSVDELKKLTKLKCSRKFETPPPPLVSQKIQMLKNCTIFSNNQKKKSEKAGEKF